MLKSVDLYYGNMRLCLRIAVSAIRHTAQSIHHYLQNVRRCYVSNAIHKPVTQALHQVVLIYRVAVEFLQGIY